MTGVCVVGPGFDSTSSAFVRSRASQEAGRDDRFAQKTESCPCLWGQGMCRHNLCRCLQHSNLVEAVSSWNVRRISSVSSTSSYSSTSFISIYQTFCMHSTLEKINNVSNTAISPTPTFFLEADIVTMGFVIALRSPFFIIPHQLLSKLKKIINID